MQGLWEEALKMMWVLSALLGLSYAEEPLPASALHPRPRPREEKQRLANTPSSLPVLLTDSELSLQEPMVPAKLGTQAEKDRRLKKK
jgi:hypothetical protein